MLFVMLGLECIWNERCECEEVEGVCVSDVCSQCMIVVMTMMDGSA